jgi:hypothetical protein
MKLSEKTKLEMEKKSLLWFQETSIVYLFDWPTPQNKHTKAGNTEFILNLDTILPNWYLKWKILLLDCIYISLIIMKKEDF